MSYKVREVDMENKWCQEAVLEVFPRVLPPEPRAPADTRGHDTPVPMGSRPRRAER